MKVLITGGCGFLGSNIAAHYLEQGAQVTIADALFRHGGSKNLEWLQSLAKGAALAFHQGDLADADFVRTVFEKAAPFDFICHVAGQVAMTTSLKEPRRDFLSNVVGTFNILEAMREFSPDGFLAYSSTNKVYGDLENLRYLEEPLRYTVPDYPNGFDESLPLDFSTPYGCSKGAADQYVRDWARVFDLETTVFRHSSIFGGRQFSTYDQGWVGWFCQKAVEQWQASNRGLDPEPFTISGTGKQVRDVLHAEDLVRLYHAAFTHRSAAAGQIFNIGGGLPSSMSLLELFEQLQRELGLERLVFQRIQRRTSDQDFFVADISKANQLLDWKPQIEAEDGIRRMIEWTRSL